METALYLKCSVCTDECENAKDLCSHIRNKHGNVTPVHCYQCKLGFLHKTSLIRHIQTKHLSECSSGSSTGNISSNPVGFSATAATSAVEEIFGDHDNRFEQILGDSSCPPSSSAADFNYKHEAATFLMKLRSSGNITGVSVSIIQDYVNQLLKSYLNQLSGKVSAFLNECEVPDDTAAEFIRKTFKFENPFEDLKSTEDQLNYFCSEYGMVKPETKFLDTRIENRFDRKLKIFLPKQVSETFQSVGLLKTLSLIVKNEYQRNLIETEKQSDDGVLRSYKDGTDFKKNQFLQRFPNACRIVLYYDDLEVSNPLGSKDTIHKLGCFYFQIQNFPPSENSKISSIYLLALTYAEDLKKEGAFSKVLFPFIQDLKKLQSAEGVNIDLPEGGTYTLRACVVNLCADSLAAHALLGLMGCGANLFCRWCMITKDDFRRDSNFVGVQRSSRLHKQHLNQIERNRAMSSRFGIKEKSPLSDVMRVPEDCVFDLFHDFVGVAQMDLKLALYEFICVRRLFSVYDFNINVNMFVYGPRDAKNKPSANFTRQRLCSSGHSLKQYGSQTFCLLRVFPFLIKGVEEGDKYLELIFLLQDIAKILFSFELRMSDVERLETLVYQHHKLFHELFISAPPAIPPPSPPDSAGEEDSEEGDEYDEDDWIDIEEDPDDPSAEPQRPRRGRRSRRLKKGINKLHHIIHYAQQAREKGPPIRLWCARFEGRHRIFRKHSSVQSNFKNIPKTMAQMFQLSTIDSILSKTGPPEIHFNTSDKSICTVSSSLYSALLLSKGLSDEDVIFVVTSVDFKGIEYSQGLFVNLQGSGNTNASPCFAIITEVLIRNADKPTIFLVVMKCGNEGLSAKFNSYKVLVLPNEEPLLVNPEDLINFRPLAPWSPISSPGDIFLHPRKVFW